MKKLLIIKADSNDADYVYSIEEVSSENVEKLKTIIPRLKINEYDGCFIWKTDEIGNPYEDYRDVLTEEEIDFFDSYVPLAEYGIHTINKIRILNVESEEDLIG